MQYETAELKLISLEVKKGVGISQMDQYEW